MAPAATLTCPSCGRANPADASFCGGCGTAMAARTCPRCGRAALPGDRFCGGCGAAFEEVAAGLGQRRHLTVMFSDLADSTRLAGELDPEDMRDLVVAYQSACTDRCAQGSYGFDDHRERG